MSSRHPTHCFFFTLYVKIAYFFKFVIGVSNFDPKWNSLDGKVSRKSHMGPYQIEDGYPQNPVGRTGICGRGILGRWGPNHAADPVVTRWKRLESGELLQYNGK